MLRKILAHLTIIFAGMCFVLFVVDKIKGGAMSFINNDITKAFIAVLSLLATANAIIGLAAQTRELRMYAALQNYRRRFGALPRASAPAARPAARPTNSAPANRPAGYGAPVSRPSAPAGYGSATGRPAAAPRRPGSAQQGAPMRSTSAAPGGYANRRAGNTFQRR